MEEALDEPAIVQKEKKPRSEKQIETFKKAQETRAKNALIKATERKEKLAQSKMLPKLLEPMVPLKPPSLLPSEPVLKEEPDEEIIVKKPKKKRIIYREESDSEEEIIIKRKPKKELPPPTPPVIMPVEKLKPIYVFL